MAGLLGGFDLSTGDPLTDAGLIGGLLTAHVGDNRLPNLLFSAAQAKMQQQNQQRLNRANDLQQLQGLYKIALQNDMLRQNDDEAAGRVHVRDPALAAMESKMGEMSGLGLLSGQNPASSMQQPPPPQMPPVASPQAAPMPGMAPASPSVMANPGYQPTPQEVQQRTQADQQTQQQTMAAQMAALRRQGDRYAIMGFNPIAENRYKMSTPVLSRGVSFDPSTGLPIAGFVNNVPVQFDQSGRPTVIPSDIPKALAQQAGGITAAQEEARAPYTTIPIPGANRLSFLSTLRATQNPPQSILPPGMQQPPSQQPIPQSVIDADKSGQPFTATQAPGGPVQFQRGGPQAATLTVTQPPLPGNGAPMGGGYQGSGLAGPDPVALEKAKAEGQAMGQEYGKAYGNLRDAAVQAPYQQAMLEEMRNLANGALSGQMGALAGFKQKLGEYMMAGGASANDVNKALNINVPNAQEFVKLALQRAMSQTRSMGAREAYAVFQQVQSGNPNMALTNEGVNKILTPLIAEQQWNQDKYNAADQWQAQKGTLAGFESNWNRTHPFRQYWQAAASQGQPNSSNGWSIQEVK